jgi:hypothetical protein
MGNGGRSRLFHSQSLETRMENQKDLRIIQSQPLKMQRRKVKPGEEEETGQGLRVRLLQNWSKNEESSLSPQDWLLYRERV